MVEIARCKCGADGRLSTGEMYASVDCSRKLCWRGPIRRTGAEAIAAWNALMSPAAPEPAAGTVRVPVQVVVDAQGDLCALANDGTLWLRGSDGKKFVWTQLLPHLPQPTEIPGTVESGE